MSLGRVGHARRLRIGLAQAGAQARRGGDAKGPPRAGAAPPDDAEAGHRWGRKEAALNMWVHLRLPYQLLLAPFFLWGAFVSCREPSWSMVLAFFFLHGPIYGGITLFNTHFDRDEGPVGGLSSPPRAGPWLLPGSYALLAFGLLGLSAAGLPVVILASTYVLLGLFYSHPSTRLKARPWAGWAAVVFGQGGLATLAGASVGRDMPMTLELGLGALTAMLLVGAFYPVTQIFQTGEDLARGDRTAAIALGVRGTQTLASALSVCGGLAGAFTVRAAGFGSDAWLFVLGGLAMAAGAAWACRHVDVLGTFHRVTRVHAAAAMGFGGYSILRIMMMGYGGGEP